MADPRLVIREVPEATQQENWTGLALFVQLPLITTKGTEWLERRLTPPETAQKNPAKPMEEGQKWAADNGYHLIRGWIGEDGLLIAPLQADPRKRGDIENPPRAMEAREL